MSNFTFLSKWINKNNQIINVFQVDYHGKEFQLFNPKDNTFTIFYGKYLDLLKKLNSEGYKSKNYDEKY